MGTNNVGSRCDLNNNVEDYGNINNGNNNDIIMIIKTDYHKWNGMRPQWYASQASDYLYNQIDRTVRNKMEYISCILIPTKGEQWINSYSGGPRLREVLNELLYLSHKCGNGIYSL